MRGDKIGDTGQNGRPVFDDCVRKHREKLKREESKSQGSFEARRRMIGRIGLPEVRAHRFEQLEREAAEWLADFNRRQELAPELVPLVIAYIEGES